MLYFFNFLDLITSRSINYLNYNIKNELLEKIHSLSLNIIFSDQSIYLSAYIIDTVELSEFF